MAQKSEKKFIKVGIGASAGGLSPLKEFARSLPEKTGMAYIIVQHLDPNHESMLSEILGRECKIPVKNAEDGETVEANNIYVIPPDTYLEIIDGAISLSEPEDARGSRKAIDHFFRSLARDCGAGCAGLVFSGSGSDGTAGLRAIKASGGLVLAQDPDEAQHSSMPQSAIDTDIVDKAVPVKEMHRMLKQYAEHPMTQRYEETRDTHKEEAQSAGQSLDDIAAILKTHEGFNLTQYKPATVQRRIARRMSLTNTDKYKDYLQLLRESKKERKHLTRDLLINVTDFFRDPEAFEVLEKTVIPEVLNNAQKGEDIRVWVAGCASGEEAYSLAILLLEALSKKRMKNELKIFATDIDEYAIKIARKGLYPESIAAEVPKKYLEKYFFKIENDHHYKIKNHVRDLISFATQNVASDPPFNHMHLISCRNLLIYLNKDVQEKVLSSFYFALDDSSFLFLGSSESLGKKAELFKTASKKWRFYQKLPGGNKKQAMLEHLHIKKDQQPRGPEPSGQKPQKQTKSLSRSDNIRRAILNTQVPATMVVKEDGTLIYSHGELEPFCTFPKGEPRNELTQLVKPAMRSRIRSAFYKVKKSDEPLIFYASLPQQGNQDEKRIVRVKIAPVEDQDFIDGTAYTVSFTEEERSEDKQEEGLTKDDEHKANAELEQELIDTKQELQNTIEELETSTEELKASHEETLSTNEELQSSNEELEASSEELRSLNEELSTVNAQLKDKIDELRRAHNDAENFFSSTDIPTIFLDPDLKIQRYTPAAEQLLKMGPRDLNREVFTLGRDLIDKELAEDCAEVLRNFQPKSKEVQDYKGNWFMRQVTPYRTEDRRIEGVVLVFQDITELKHLSQRAEGREKQQAVVARLGMLALSGAEPEELMQQAVRQVAYVLDADYCKVLAYQPEEHNFLLVSGIGWQDGLVGKATVPDDQSSQAGYTLLSKDPVIVQDLTSEKRFSGPSLLIDHHVISGISCLINHTEPPYGVLGVHSKDRRQFTEDDANFLQSVANMLSTALRTKHAQEQIADSEARLKMARDAAQIGIHDYDVVNNTIIWDDTVREIWGVPKDLEPITYEVFQDGLHPEDRERIAQEISEAAEKPGKYSWEYRVINGLDNSLRFITATGKIIHENGRAVRIVGTVHDVTDRKNLEHSLKKAVNDLQEIDQKKNDFLSILGHELRNPLAAVCGSVEIFERSNPENQQIFNVMKHSLQTMSSLLDDLLDLNRVSQNKIQLYTQPLELKKLLAEAMEQTHTQCAKKDLEVTVDIDDNLWVIADQTRLEQVFTNLILNACKYTPKGGRIALEAKRQNNDDIRIDIHDSGVGIEDVDLEKIFNPFYQIKPDGQAAQGLGIGLALAKNLVEMHEGQIEAHSEGRDQGSTFSVILPSQKQHELGLPSSREDELHIRPGLKVLLIEDNEDILITMPMLLETLECVVETAKSAQEGIDKVLSFKPDVIFADIGLPDMDGHEAAKEIRAGGYKGRMAALSGYSHAEIRQKSQQAGFDQHLAKPAKLLDLIKVLAKAA